MAKQNVTFIERHLEKFVIGICGAVFLAVVATYAIDTPHKVMVDGQPLAPKNFYNFVEEQASQVVNRMKNARTESDNNPQVVIPNQNPSPYTAAQLPLLFTSVFVSPSPPIPIITDLIEKETVQLAKIVAPSTPVLTTGRGSGKLPESDEIQIAFDNKSPATPQNSLDLTKDYVWATVVTTINRKEQRERFEAAGYTSSRLALVVTNVEAEREELLPSGEWGEPQIVHSYAPTVFVPAESVQLTQQDKDFVVAPDQMTLIDKHHQKFATDAQQAEILRPKFKDYLEDPEKWILPKTLPGVELNWEEFGIQIPEEEKNSRFGAGRKAEETEKPRGRKSSAAEATAADSALLQEVSKTMKEADKAIAEKKYLEAEEKLLSVKSHSESTSPNLAGQARIATTKLDGIATEIEEAKVAEAQKLRRKEEASKFNFGPDIDPVWINDLTIAPSKVYRYRVRVVALNQYAGLPAELRTPEDAAKLVLQGEWSKWSDPLTVESDKRLFFSGIDGDNQSAKLELYQWGNGKWKPALIAKLGIGRPLVFGTGKSAVTYGVVVDIDPHRHYRSEKENLETQAMILVTSNGDVEEHLLIEDSAKKKEFLNKKKEEENRRPAEVPQQTVKPRPAPRPAGRPPANAPGRPAPHGT